MVQYEVPATAQIIKDINSFKVVITLQVWIRNLLKHGKFYPAFCIGVMCVGCFISHIFGRLEIMHS